MKRPHELDLQIAADPRERVFVRHVAATQGGGLEVLDDVAGVVGRDDEVDVSRRCDRDRRRICERHLERRGADHDNVVEDRPENISRLGEQPCLG